MGMGKILYKRREMPMEQKKQIVFKIGDKVTNLSGDRKGTVVRIGPFGKTGHVMWENEQQEMVRFSNLKEL